MLAISRILIPVDFSKRCLGMTHYARAIAESYGAEIVLLRVVNPVFVTPDIGIAPPVSITIPKWMLDEEARKLEEFAAGELAGLRLRRLVYEGLPEEQIAALAESEHVDMLVMSTHGYGGFRRFLIGSIAAKVLDDVACPVLTGVHMDKHVDDKTSFARIACALDLEPKSREVLAWAAGFAVRHRAKLSIVHVKPPAAPGSGIAHADELKPQLEELVKAELGQSGAALDPADVTVCIQEGEIAHAVCDFASNSGANLLVVGREAGAKSAGKRSDRLRTHTYSIIRESPCPVLSV
jgi:nucleotide-binding universal stress UspA family protein